MRVGTSLAHTGHVENNCAAERTRLASHRVTHLGPNLVRHLCGWAGCPCEIEHDAEYCIHATCGPQLHLMRPSPG